RPVAGECLLERGEALNARARALRVGVADHDVAEDLGGVEELEPTRAASALVFRPPAVVVLFAEEDVRRAFEACRRERADAALLRLERDLDALGRAIRHGPRLLRGREGESAARRVAEVALAIVDVVLNLVFLEPRERLGERRARRGLVRGG